MKKGSDFADGKIPRTEVVQKEINNLKIQKRIVKLISKIELLQIELDQLKLKQKNF